VGKLIKITGLLFILQLWGCSVLVRDDGSKLPRAYKSDPSKSYALNVMAAASLDKGLYDVPKPEKLNSLSASRLRGQIIGGGLAAATIGAGASLLKGGFLVGMSGRDSVPADFLQIFAWVPKELAGNKKDAESLFKKTLLNALLTYALERGMKKMDINENGSIAYLEWKELSDTHKPVISGEENYYVEAVGSEHFTDRTKRHLGKMMIPVNAPGFLDGGGAFFTYSTNRNHLHSYGHIKYRLPSILLDSGVERNIAISKLLPKWIYLYMPPRKKSSYQHLPIIPTLINQGDTHFFFKPDAK